MANYLTVDGGTTNTRVHLVVDGRVVDTKKLSVGAKNNLDGQSKLKEALREAISDVLSRNGLLPKEITRILASGMITSEFGLCPLKHLPLPADKTELHNVMHETAIPEISEIPFVFLRGVITDCQSLQSADVMRGEETELMGILQDKVEKALYVLPGSHSKLISVDANGKITDFKTMLSGELFAAVAQNTILRDAVDFSITEPDFNALEDGYVYCRRHGINEALFKVRILKNIFGASREACFGFLRGAVLCGEVEEILKAEEETVILGGQKQFREALTHLLCKHSYKNVICLPDDVVNRSTAIGAVRIYEAASCK